VPDRPLNIALSIWMFKQGTGGLQAHAEQLARNLIRKGHKVTVITRAYSRVPEGMDFLYFREQVSSTQVGDIPVRAIGYTPWLKPLHWFIAKAKERVFLRRIAIRLFQWQARIGNRDLYAGYDVVHHVGQATALLGYAAADGALRNDIPFTVQPTCHPFQIGDTPLDLDLYRLACRCLVHTHYEADHLRPLLEYVPIDVVGNGIEDRTDGDGARFREQHSIDGPMILYIGRRDRDKGYPLIVEAYRKLRYRIPKTTLVCMGPEGAVEKADDPGIVHFDFADEQTKHDALAACTCLCVPSEGESFGLVYMEAGRYSKPVVARRLPVLDELLQKGSCGVLVGSMYWESNSNTVDSQELAKVLSDLLENVNQQTLLGQRSFKASSEFVWDKVVRSFETSLTMAVSEY
jgi:glycosyltransferase involved in cell wall biosynthesis